ncbi:MAG TPA: cupin domain-containing protein [Chitinophagaceae bacterium]|jgi:mannose-6-phosphate isomerase-like protein (cupin superfamily)|nr:cupin domain-containing protein [Chitinophagaceae bacterium]
MNAQRRLWLKTAGLSGLSVMVPGAWLRAGTQNAEEEGFVSQPEDQETYLIGPRRAPVTIIVDRQKKGIATTSFCKEDIRPGSGIPVHKHLNEAELIYIQQGSGLFLLGEKEHPVQAGTTAYVPKSAWHGIRNTGSDTLVMLFSFTPSGFENYFREIGSPAGTGGKDLTSEAFAAIDQRYGIVYRGK